MNARQRKGKRKAHDEASVNRLRNIEDIEEHNLAADMLWVMSDSRGRRVMAALCDRLNESQGYPVDTTGRGDPLVAAFDHGMRHAAAEIDDEIKELTPELWVTMQSERLIQRSNEVKDE